MPLREFTDDTGKRWTVWSTAPDWRGAVLSDFRDGWLTFESGSLRRRLAPIPADWEEASATRLSAYLTAATRVAVARRSETREADPRD